LNTLGLGERINRPEPAKKVILLSLDFFSFVKIMWPC